MRKKIVTAAVAVALAATMSISAFAAVGSPVGGVKVDESTVTVTDEKTGTKKTETIRTTTEAVRDSSNNVIDLDGTTEAVVKITTVSQATSANEAAGTNVGNDTLTNNSRTVGQNKNLIAENQKTAHAGTTEEALNTVQSGLATTTEKTLKKESMDSYVNNYNQAQTVEIVFNKAAEKLAAKGNGVKITMRVAGAQEGTRGFVQYYDVNGKAHIIPVTFGKDGRVSFILPNSSIVRIFTAKSANVESAK